MMRLFSFRGTVLRMHLLFPLMLLFLIANGQYILVSAYLIVLLLHEAGHCWMAKRFKIQVVQIEITPFGGSMQLLGVDTLSPFRAFLLGAAGPAMNLICLLLGVPLSARFFPLSEWMQFFLSFHAMMLLINLLPVLPLDGGRMLLALLSGRADYARIKKALLFLGRIISVFLIILSGYRTLQGHLSFSCCLLGLYLLYALALEEKTGTARYLAAFIERRIQLEKRKTLPVQHLAAAENMSLALLVAHLRPEAYHIVEVLDASDMTRLGNIEEDGLLNAMLQTDAVILRDLLK